MRTGAPTAAITRPKTKHRSVLVSRNMEPKAFLPEQVACHSLVSFWHQLRASYRHITGEIYVHMKVTL